jgi:hypothetical protein
MHQFSVILAYDMDNPVYRGSPTAIHEMLEDSKLLYYELLQSPLIRICDPSNDYYN